VRELLAQCEASELDLQQQQHLPSMPPLVPPVSLSGPSVDNLTARRTKVGSYFACVNSITVHQFVSCYCYCDSDADWLVD